MSSPSPACPSCGQPASGKFCRHCGTTLGDVSTCVRCGTPLPPSGRFCPSCGTSVSSRGGLGPNERLWWFLGGGGLVALVGGLVLGLGRENAVTDPELGASTGAPFASGVAGGAAPDISNLTPRERFDRLFNRVMRSAESGDEAAVASFAPMALSAYHMLDSVDADARYHAALIELHTGDVDGASALADSLLTGEPGHLFGYVVRGTIARFQKNDRVLQQTYRDFLAHYDAEKARKRPEYDEHARALEEFRKAAKAASGGPKS